MGFFMTAKALNSEKPMSKKQENQHDNLDENQEEDAVSLFNKINSEDSTKDSDENDLKEELDQDDETDKDDNAGEEVDEQDEEDQDPWASAPEPLRNQYQTIQQANQKLQNDFNALQGRLAPAQRELETLKKQLTERDKQTGGDTAKDVPSAEDLSEMSDDQIENEFPEVAAFIRQREKQFQKILDERLNPLQQMQQSIEEKERTQRVQSDLQRVAQVHPDFQQVVSDPLFGNWLNSQPNAIQRIAESMDADDNIALLNLYKGQLPVKADKPTQNKKSLSNQVELPRKGSGRGLVNLDDADPVALFNKINS